MSTGGRTVAEEASVSRALGLVVLAVLPLVLLLVVAHAGSALQAVAAARAGLLYVRARAQAGVQRRRARRAVTERAEPEAEHKNRLITGVITQTEP